MKQIYHFQELEEKMQSEKEMVFLKHSNTCPRSAQAYQELSNFEKNEKVPVYYVVVQENRDFSNEVAAQFQITHQSPQAFYIKNNEMVWEGHHWAITEQALIEVKGAYGTAPSI